MFKEIYELFISRGEFFACLIIQHLFLSLLSIIIASILGLVLAVLAFGVSRLRPYILGFASLIYVVPSISLLGLLIPFSGVGDTTALIALSLYALLPMIRTTYTAISSTEKSLIEAATALGASWANTLFLVRLPLGLVQIISAIKTMSVMTISLAGIAAFIGAGGLGVAIYRGISTNNQALIIAGSLLIALLALFFEGFVGLLGWLIRTKRQTLAFVLAFVVSVSVLGAKLYEPKDRGIVIASKPMSEQFIIANAIALLIEQDLGERVSLVLGVGGGTSNIQPAMLSGEFDIYPEYTGTAWSAVLGKKEPYKDDKFNELLSEYANKFDFSLLAPLGFNNTFSLAIRQDVANKYRLKTFSDLARVSPLLSLGAEPDFYERDDGYRGLKWAYGMRFRAKKEIDIGLKYSAIIAGKIDAINTFSTDARLASDSLVRLRDDLGFYPSYKAILIVRNETLKRYKGLENSLKKLENLIDDKTMSALNAKVELDGQSPKDVAAEFLRQKGLLDD
ncbi:glycine/betaine ABC transporter substrate-binding protein [Campylobacter sp. 19-13652]|nr:glycine/betaine ABC transporter substrate-binding protein [Campylobacter sp. 19-13652]